MAPTQTKKNGRSYGYYVSHPLLFGKAASAKVGSVSRVPAQEIEEQIRKVILEPRLSDHKDTKLINNAFASSLINRIDVQKTRLVVQLKQDLDIGTPGGSASSIVISWTKPPSRRARSVLTPISAKLLLRPIKLERRATLIAAIARGRRWLDELITGNTLDAQTIAAREHFSLRHVTMTLSLAFLSPTLIKAAVEGRLPRGIGVERLRELPLEWERQLETLHLNQG